MLEAWRDRSRLRVTVLHQANAGQGSARNTGLRHASGEWVTFTDPDDMLDRRFLEAADAFARAHPDVEVMTPRVMLFDEARNRIRNRHPRRWQFSRGDQVINLEREPNAFTGGVDDLVCTGSTASGGTRAPVRRPRSGPAFEDGHFAARLPAGRCLSLASASSGEVHLPQARGDSPRRCRPCGSIRAATPTSSSTATRTSSAVGRSRDGRVPEWLQQVLVYELSWYLAENDSPSSHARPRELATTFRGHLAETCSAPSIPP